MVLPRAPFPIHWTIGTAVRPHPDGNTEGLIMIKRALGRSGLQIP